MSQNFHLRKNPTNIWESSDFSKFSELADENILLQSILSARKQYLEEGS